METLNIPGIHRDPPTRDALAIALKWLDRAYTHKDELHLIKGDPMLDKIDRDPRYKAFLRKMNLPE